MFLLGQWLAAPLSAIFVATTRPCWELTVSAYHKLSPCAFLFMGFAMYASAFFGAQQRARLGRSSRFCARSCSRWRPVIVLPMLFGIDGILALRSRWATGSPAWWPPRSVALSGRYGYRKGGLSAGESEGRKTGTRPRFLHRSQLICIISAS